jgi:hypothetical protein
MPVRIASTTLFALWCSVSTLESGSTSDVWACYTVVQHGHFLHPKPALCLPLSTFHNDFLYRVAVFVSRNPDTVCIGPLHNPHILSRLSSQSVNLKQVYQVLPTLALVLSEPSSTSKYLDHSCSQALRKRWITDCMRWKSEFGPLTMKPRAAQSETRPNSSL